MKESKWKYRVISIQLWNDNAEQIISEHKSLKGAESMLKGCEKKNATQMKKYPNLKHNKYYILSL